jgi:hypothetical protein
MEAVLARMAMEVVGDGIGSVGDSGAREAEFDTSLKFFAIAVTFERILIVCDAVPPALWFSTPFTSEATPSSD